MSARIKIGLGAETLEVPYPCCRSWQAVASACHGLLPLLEHWDQCGYSESQQIAADLSRKRVNKHSRIRDRTGSEAMYCLVHGCHAMHAFATHF
ncbi:hypothetical protein NXS19_003734 [Fusarium pseudograminearum]|nr:hypothetical protein NXS19_003734 [Fusarium pseudograminearum]